jgi:hypothetical protein
VADSTPRACNDGDLIFESHVVRSLSPRSGGLQTAVGGL